MAADIREERCVAIAGKAGPSEMINRCKPMAARQVINCKSIAQKSLIWPGSASGPSGGTAVSNKMIEWSITAFFLFPRTCPADLLMVPGCRDFR